jgi:hypothetical protein
MILLCNSFCVIFILFNLNIFNMYINSFKLNNDNIYKMSSHNKIVNMYKKSLNIYKKLVSITTSITLSVFSSFVNN